MAGSDTATSSDAQSKSGESNRLATNDSALQSAMLKAKVANSTCDAAARIAQQHRAADGEADDGGDQRGDGLDAQSVTILHPAGPAVLLACVGPAMLHG